MLLWDKSLAFFHELSHFPASTLVVLRYAINIVERITRRYLCIVCRCSHASGCIQRDPTFRPPCAWRRSWQEGCWTLKLPSWRSWQGSRHSTSIHLRIHSINPLISIDCQAKKKKLKCKINVRQKTDNNNCNAYLAVILIGNMIFRTSERLFDLWHRRTLSSTFTLSGWIPARTSTERTLLWFFGFPIHVFVFSLEDWQSFRSSADLSQYVKPL
jgi:hypothetical protein